LRPFEPKNKINTGDGRKMMDGVTLALGFAVLLAPNSSVNAFSTAFLSSSGLTQRRSDIPFTPFITALKLGHPVAAFDAI